MNEQPNQGNGPSQPAVAAGPAIVCPYCGHAQRGGEGCESCGGLFEPLSRQATQNAMGAWFIREEEQPFRPGCSYSTLKKLAARGKIRADSIIRGPTTRQFWSFARDTPGVANLLGECHNCHGPAEPDEYMCRACGAVFVAPTDRQGLGLAPVRLLPGDAAPDVVADSFMTRPTIASTRFTALPPSATQPVAAPRGVSAAHPAGNGSVPAAPAAAPPARPSASSLAASRRARQRAANMRLLAFAISTLCALFLIVIIAIAMRAARRAPQDPATATPASPAGAASGAAAVSDPAPPGPAEPAAAASADEKARWADEHASAMGLANTGGRDRLELAIRRLKAIRDAAPRGAWPETLEADLARLEKRLDDEIASKFY